MAYQVTACVVMAYIVMAYSVMAYVVMASIVMALTHGGADDVERQAVVAHVVHAQDGEVR